MGNKTKNSNLSVVVVGMGVVGLPVALMLSNAGYRIIGVDINNNIVESINNGKLPPQVKEKELEHLLNTPKVKRNLKVQQVPEEADVFIIAVPTPLDKSSNKADLSFVVKATESIVPYLKKRDLVIVESTIPPLTCRKVVAPLLEKTGLAVGKDIFLAHCPERILPGNIYHEIVHNDRIIGGVNEESSEMAMKLYASFVKGDILLTDDITAELCKLTENAFRDVNVAFANEISLVAQNLGVDHKQVIEFANKHPRVNILEPGIGVGGHCIPIDPWFIYEVDDHNSSLISTARRINDEMPSKIANRIIQTVQGIVDPKIIAIGASYKPNTSDIRESPALKVVELLRKKNLNVSHYDPLIDEYNYKTTLLDACEGADLLVILVSHKEVLKELNDNRKKILRALKTPQILEF